MSKKPGSYGYIEVEKSDHGWRWRLDVWHPECRIVSAQSSYKRKSSAKRAATKVARQFRIDVECISAQD